MLHLQNDTPIQIRRYSLRASKVTQTMKVKEIKHNTFGKRAQASGLESLPVNSLPVRDEIEAFQQSLKIRLFLQLVNESMLAQ